ncbi:hypothetical protein BN8_01449 [Fibrisoma limi BUZ 3]|uniref:3-keto-disaccharide hydrolase domain-containing protein n=1 Tax=Fibrisoma limi BUZ 3 TaxID=1185876 RepID=I2GEX1_9BACT|nr:hypothetical protein [Fibrisoma limi]CCH52446.1 hypothetical protein BN8_01449 [Fibrisoma limi BUZ 3]
MKQIHNAPILLYLLCSLLMNGHSSAQSVTPISPDLTSLAGNPKAAVNRAATVLTEGRRNGIRIDEKPGEGLVWIPDVQLTNGTLEFDVRGKDVLQRSFVGIAFHGQDDKTYEAIYFRPFNFRSTDPVRRVHAVQYVAHPTYTWQKLRADFPDKFEAALTSPPDPNDWFHARVEIKASSVRVFVNQNTTPALEVERLVQTQNGRVGLWVGNGSGGDFANLTITPVP